jgi:hypothetical protein
VYLLTSCLFAYLSDYFNPDLKTALFAHLRRGKRNEGIDSADTNSVCLEQQSRGTNIIDTLY